MKHKLNFQLWLITLIFYFNFFPNFSVKAETILEEINRTGLLKVGVRTDAIPFGYRNNNSELQGICFDLIALIREQLRKKINRNIISVNIVISRLSNRFELVQDGIVHLECGPNTIRTIDDYKVTFSKDFFISGIQFFVKENMAPKFLNSDGTNLNIGLLRYTNTEILIKEKYPKATFQLFQGMRGTQRALQAVRQGTIDGFADDGILLIGESIAQQIFLGKSQGYVLTPQPPLTCEKYGLIIPKNDPSWENFINTILNSEEKNQLLKNWFRSFNNELNLSQNNCN
ncbi:transporter substrate-binding domain-containing protein [Geminocystis sp. GBBB08]|uniref:transporter substrate-binding domain-containing protein n=1 Tax=Geminocystis sp. GBBB08 TaxID=2604140 RepID=UPI0027E3B020|nr:transporter substrate-binding domain-containing protein [Geminocystis sp. GBBB08]MBL1210931.1 transporter substrate-binding domain-containing protein [Geminocystis sp. GBBB08]